MAKDRIFHSVGDLIGRTPLVELERLEADWGTGARVLAKMEYFNPTGSAKDRIALTMIDAAERDGRLKPGGTIIEETSGNTGIGLCAIAAARGYRCIIVMPETMSVERQKLMRAYGAEVVLTPGALGMSGALDRAHELHESIPGSIIAGQFDNPANPEAHYLTTGPEIWGDTDGGVDYFVAGVGTGGTITGTARYLLEKNPAVKIIAVEPASSPLLSAGRAGAHGLQGIGADFVPEVLDRALLHEILTVADEEAFAACRALARHEGFLCGITSGAALVAARQIAARPEAAGKTIVALLPDTGTRYLSTTVFEGEA